MYISNILIVRKTVNRKEFTRRTQMNMTTEGELHTFITKAQRRF